MTNWVGPAPSTVLVLAAISSSLVALGSIARRPRAAPQWMFAVGMVGLAVEAAAAWMLLTVTESSVERSRWLQVRDMAGLLLLVPWSGFVAHLAWPRGGPLPPSARVALRAAWVVATGLAAAVFVWPPFVASEVPGPFFAAQLDRVGQYSAIFELLVTVGLLASLEACLRTSRGTVRWRIKYLVLGLGGIFLARFFFLSQLLLFQVLLAGHLTAEAGTLVAGQLAVAAALARDRLLSGDIAVSRQVLYRSAVVAVLGAYLVVVGGLGWLFNLLGIPEELLWGSLILFVSALALGGLLLSEDLRWRLKRFIALNFYRQKYDYREHWGRFTRRLGPLLSVERLAPELLDAVAQAAGATRGVLYLVESRDGRYHRAADLETEGAPDVLPEDGPLVVRLREEPRPAPLQTKPDDAQDGERRAADAEGELVRLLGQGAIALPLRWGQALSGVLLLGPERSGHPYNLEDLEFLATVGEQAAGTIAVARLSESLAQAREFEAFHRLTSFVIHDLKNSISALSLLSDNALRHFDDPEFQKDAIKTLSRTVERMRGLLNRLAAAPMEEGRRREPVDLATLALEATRALGGSDRLHLVKDLAPLAPVPGDPEALLRVIQNLVTNAVEALPGGQGTITVRTSWEQGWAVFEVTDTGRGMSAEFLRTSLFAPFSSTKRGGWGLGLYQARAAVEAHGGRLEVASREGHGTTFWVRLPVEPSRSPGEAPRGEARP